LNDFRSVAVIVHRAHLIDCCAVRIGEHGAVGADQRVTRSRFPPKTPKPLLQFLTRPAGHSFVELAAQQFGRVAQPAVHLLHDLPLQLAREKEAKCHKRHQTQPCAGEKQFPKESRRMHGLAWLRDDREGRKLTSALRVALRLTCRSPYGEPIACRNEANNY
jgi:hypothetical protein